MKSWLSGSFILFLLSITSGEVFKQYIYFNMYYTSSDAQRFCNEHSGNLATIYTQPDVDGMWLKQYAAWIGLYSTTSDWYWTWLDGSPYYVNWDNWGNNVTYLYDSCAVVSYNDKKFYGTNCGDYASVLCEKFTGFLGPSQYIFISEAMTWSDAQQYCNTKFNRLAKLFNSNLNDIVKDQDFPIWIGLYRNGGTWNWTTGISDYVNWNPGEPSDGDCVTVTSLSKKMATQICDTHFPFICMFENVLLVKENKSWEEALDYCRSLISPISSNLRFDLLSMQPGDEQGYLMTKMMEANTAEVWTGLRFLAGEWMWVNGADMFYTNLPLCPILEQHCGAISKSNPASMATRDCLERKNFMCYAS